jgi:hypothetical protein
MVLRTGQIASDPKFEPTEGYTLGAAATKLGHRGTEIVEWLCEWFIPFPWLGGFGGK